MSKGHSVGAALAVAALCFMGAIREGRVEAGEGGAQEMVVDFVASVWRWQSIDDAVMGGLSSSEMVVENGIAVFRGEVSLDNNGGFASVRSEARDHDLSGFDGLVLRVRGDGKRYRFRLRTTSANGGVSYQASLEPEAEAWQEVAIPFVDFEAVFRGRRVPSQPPLDPTEVKTFGLLIAGRQAGAFRLEIEWIRGYRHSP